MFVPWNPTTTATVPVDLRGRRYIVYVDFEVSGSGGDNANKKPFVGEKDSIGTVAHFT